VSPDSTTTAPRVNGQIVDIAALRQKRKRGGVHVVHLSDELTVKVTLVDIVTLIAQKRIPNQLLRAAMNLQNEGMTGMTPEKLTESLEFMDALCATIIKEPKWCRIEEAGEDAAPDDMLCLADLSQEERDAVFSLVYGGLEGLEKFRTERRSAAAARASEGVQTEAERSGVPEGSGPREALVRSGDPVSGEDVPETETPEPDADTLR
jgi:hypothetical protein